MLRRRIKPPLWTIPAWYVVVAVLAALYLPRLELWLDLGFSGRIGSSAALAIYVVAIALAFFYPLVSCALYAAVAAMWLWPDQRFERLLQT